VNVERVRKYGSIITLQDLNIEQLLVQGQMYMQMGKQKLKS
jgi:hypothetical protein